MLVSMTSLRHEQIVKILQLPFQQLQSFTWHDLLGQKARTQMIRSLQGLVGVGNFLLMLEHHQLVLHDSQSLVF